MLDSVRQHRRGNNHSKDVINMVVGGHDFSLYVFLTRSLPEDYFYPRRTVRIHGLQTSPPVVVRQSTPSGVSWDLTEPPQPRHQKSLVSGLVGPTSTVSFF